MDLGVLHTQQPASREQDGYELRKGNWALGN